SLIDSVVMQMPEGMKKIWYMSRTENLSTDQIAGVLNISPLTVKKQLTNALRMLRSQLRNF
ncbi:MAG TPA: sigma factor-like helix-turn-helix DNA-binding protein, partial [Dyadobacter sp.]|nr:sigma factor-like helix-turn-helix DNA-binding protein [Dyadobacter sp.]